MNGLLIINKPAGFTSHDIVNKMRRTFKTKRVGHLGTLDPDATGVLVICLNDATKLVQFLESDVKVYQCTICLGIQTTTGDLTGEVIKKNDLPLNNNLSSEQIDDCLKSFIGTSWQLPPMYSAVKVNGKKLYEYARENKAVELPQRIIEIFNLIRISDIEIDNCLAYFTFNTTVSKGTYIRSLCEDIGKRLSLPATMAKLQRVQSGIFKLEDSYTLEQVESGNYSLISMENALADYPKIYGNVDLIKMVSHGMRIPANDVHKELKYYPEKVAIINEYQLLALYEYDKQKEQYKALRVWN